MRFEKNSCLLMTIVLAVYMFPTIGLYLTSRPFQPITDDDCRSAYELALISLAETDYDVIIAYADSSFIPLLFRAMEDAVPTEGIERGGRN